MLGSASPLAMRTVENSEAIFHLELLELNVYLAFTSYAYEISGVQFVNVVRLVRAGAVRVARYTVFAVPSDGCFVVELRRCSLDALKHVLPAGPLEGIVFDVGLEHGF